jgi:hypothetical protein
MRESLLSQYKELCVCCPVRRSTVVDNASWRIRHPDATLTRYAYQGFFPRTLPTHHQLRLAETTHRIRNRIMATVYLPPNQMHELCPACWVA